MHADALEPLDDGEDLPRNVDSQEDPWPPETIDGATEFLRLNVSRANLRPCAYPSRPQFHLYFLIPSGVVSAND